MEDNIVVSEIGEQWSPKTDPDKTEENVNIVNNFLIKHQDFTILPSNALLPANWVNLDGFLMTMPYKTKTDALFAAVLLKKE